MPLPLQPVQRQMHLPVSQRVVLVSLDVARVETGWHMDDVIQWSDTQWAFDLSTGTAGGRRNIRLWRECLTHPERVSQVSVDQVVEEVIGSPLEPMLRTSRLETRWSLDNRTLLRLTRSGALPGVLVARQWRIRRPILRTFLLQRLCR